MPLRTYLARKVTKAAVLLLLVALGTAMLRWTLYEPLLEEHCEGADCYLQRQS